MKKYLFACIVIAFTVSCAKEKGLDIVENKSEGEIVAPAGERVTISAALPEDLLTKVSFVPTILSDKPTGMALTWATGDQIRVYNHADHSQYEDFTLDPSCDGQKKGIFNGTAISASSYDIEVINTALTVGTQVQAADGDTGHLKYYASVEDVPSYDSITFTDLSSVLALTAKMPSPEVAASITSVDVTASENIFGTGNTLTLTLTTPGSADDILHLFANLPMGTTAIPASTTLIIHFNSNQAAHSVYTRYVELAEGNFAAGKLNTININASQSGTHAGPTSCDGTTAANAYLIGDKYQMLAVASELAAGETRYFKMIDDVDMDGLSWTALNPTPFTKVINFDGNNKKISNLNASLFDDLNGTVVNLTIEDATVSGGSAITGILAKTIQTAASTVTNVDVVGTVTSPSYSSSVTATAYTGGLIGQIDADNTSITDCDVIKTNVSGTLAGGVIGFANALVTMSGCTYSGGTVSATARYCGGMLGSTGNFNSTITDCHVANATVTSTVDRVGGFVGQVQTKVTISACSVTGGSVYAGTINVGGFAGTQYGAVSDSYVDGTTVTSGNTTSTTTVALGGFAGYHQGTLTKCHANVNINQSGAFLGGLVGQMVSGSVSKCYAIGNVTGDYRQVGGLIGGLTTDKSFTISDSYATGNIEANSYVGGLIGEIQNNITNVSVTNCYASGNVNTTSFAAGGLIGMISKASVSVSECAAWNGSVSATSRGSGNWSSGAVVGVAFPICTLTDNFRKPSMTLTVWWVPDADYDHPNVSSSAPLVVKDISTSALRATTATSTASGQDNRPQYAYHGKHSTTGILSTLASTAKGSGGLGWSGDVWDFTADLPTLK